MPRPPPLPRSTAAKTLSTLAICLAIGSLLTLPVTVLHLLGMLVRSGSDQFVPYVFWGAGMATGALCLGLLARRPLVPGLLALPSLIVQGPFAAILLSLLYLANVESNRLHRAVIAGDVAALQRALAQDDSDRWVNWKLTPQVNWALKQQDDKEWAGHTPLSIAVVRNEPEMVRMLLDAGAKQTDQVCNRDCSMRGSLIMFAAQHNSPAMLDSLAANWTGGSAAYSDDALWEALANRIAYTGRAIDDPQRAQALADNDRVLATLLRKGYALRERVQEDCRRQDEGEAPRWALWTAIPEEMRADLCRDARALGTTPPG